MTQPGNDHKAHEQSRHVADLLPEYVMGTLAEHEAQTVRNHLLACSACAAEMNAWQQIAAAEHAAARTAVAPSLALLNRVWAEIEAPVASALPASTVNTPLAPATASLVAGVWAFLRHGWCVALRQARLLRPSIWLASALAILLATVYALLLPPHDALGVSGVLTFALPLIAAAGTAFIYGPETDKGLELTLATPTSSRLVMLSRFSWIFAYNAALALLATLPMALLSSISLALSLLLGPAIALGGALVLWLGRVLHLSDGISVHLTPDVFWQTTPQMLLIALLVLLLALWYVPRHERLVQ